MKNPDLIGDLSRALAFGIANVQALLDAPDAAAARAAKDTLEDWAVNAADLLPDDGDGTGIGA